MERRTTAWFSQNLNIEMPLVAYGHAGYPLLMLPTAAADYLEYERFHLVDSIKKKIHVVEAVIESLGLKNATATWNRAENISEKYHFVVSRAVSDLKTLYTWTKNKISSEQFNDLKNGLLILKGGDLTDELQSLNVKTCLYSIGDFFEEEYFKEKWVLYVPKK